jgi:hypothetical protein
MSNGGRNSDSGFGSSMADPKPRLVSLEQERKEKKIRDELSGETRKRELSKVSLPKFSWDKQHD